MTSTPASLALLQRQWARRAAHFSQFDAVVREIDQRLLERLALIKLQPQRVLDAGCAAGGSRAALQARYPQAHWLGVDFSADMLQQIQLPRTGLWSKIRQQKMPWQQKTTARADVVQADFQHLPLATQSVNLLYSNLALALMTLATQPQFLFSEWQRVLHNEGVLMFSTLGPDTFQELRQAWNDDSVTLRFTDMHDWGDLLVHAGFADPVMDMEKITLTYASAEALLTELRALTVFTPPVKALADKEEANKAGVDKGLAGKQRWQRALKNLQGLADDQGRIPLTLEIIYGHAWRGAPKQKRLADGAVAVPLSQIATSKRSS